MHEITKYPRTRHLEGSRLQEGDEDLEAVPFAGVKGRFLVAEEKLDGANAGISFSPGGSLRLQSRGHELSGGPRERQFGLLKEWAAVHHGWLREILGARYVAYGEWLFAKHTVYYDALEHYFYEFDVLDTVTGRFFSTEMRRTLWNGTPMVSVPVLAEGRFQRLADLTRLVAPCSLKTPRWREALREEAEFAGVDFDRVIERETDLGGLAEGLYLKVEEGDATVDRLKWVRHDFVSRIGDSESHWQDRPILRNRLRPGVDLYALP